VGLLLLLALGLSALGMLVNGDDEVSQAAALTGTAPVGGEEVALGVATATLSSTATLAPTVTLAPPIVSTSTLSPTPPATATSTATPTASATSGPSPTPSNTPLPTDTPTATKPPPLPTPIGGYSLTVRVPILMYHYISEPPEDADEYRTDLSVPPDQFRQQMQYLADHGFTTIDFYDLALATTARGTLPEKPVILTFDDGYLDNYEHAFPILQEFGFEGTFFVVTEFVDFNRPGYMTWEMIKEMSAAGMRIEPHSKTHADLSGQSRDTLIWEILGSQQTIEAHIGYTPRFFCYPGGRYDEDTIAILQELDFWGAVTTAGGKWHGHADRYEWSRLRMRYTTDLPTFAVFVEPAQ
jgi:peptidoglycan/xylan/chitin deacetylase (PgdA/CDA1 family)